MATRQVLAELGNAFEQDSGVRLDLESVGGVDAAKRVQAGEPFDAVILASDAIDKLVAAGKADGASKTDIVRSGVSIAVRKGTARPDTSSEEALKRAVLAARTLGYSTGPSGTALLKLFEEWGIAEELKPRIVQAPPGVPVGSLVAKGEVELGFQQTSELIHLDGIDIVAMPGAVQIITIFSGALVAGSPRGDAVRAMLSFMASPEAAQAKRRQGMEPA